SSLFSSNQLSPADTYTLSLHDALPISGRTKSSFRNLNTRVVELPAAAVDALASRSDVDFVSLDRSNIPFGHLSFTTGADVIRRTDRKSTRLNSSHLGISYAVFCLKKKK